MTFVIYPYEIIHPPVGWDEENKTEDLKPFIKLECLINIRANKEEGYIEIL